MKLLDLPLDALSLVVTHVASDATSLWNVAHTCRLLRDIHGFLFLRSAVLDASSWGSWGTRSMDEYSAQQIEYIRKYGRYIRRIQLTSIPRSLAPTTKLEFPMAKLFDTIADGCENIEDIDVTRVRDVDWVSAPHTVRRLLHRCTNIQGLHLPRTPCTVFRQLERTDMGHVLGIKRLTLFDVAQSASDITRVLSSLGQSLEHLTLSGGGVDCECSGTGRSAEHSLVLPSLKTACFHALAFRQSSIRWLLTSVIDAVSPHMFYKLQLGDLLCKDLVGFFEHVARTFPLTLCVHLEDCNILSEDQCRLFRALGPRLRALHACSDPPSAGGIHALARWCTRLTKLSVSAPQRPHVDAQSPVHAAVAALGPRLDALTIRNIADSAFALDALDMSAVRHLGLYYTTVPCVRDVARTLAGSGARLRSLRLHVLEVGLAPHDVERLVEAVASLCPAVTVVELDVWGTTHAETNYGSECARLDELQRRLPSCNLEWSRLHLQNAMRTTRQEACGSRDE